MNVRKHHLFWPCLSLASVSIILALLWWYIPGERLSGIFGNLAAGFFGTVVTVLFVDRVIEAHEERQRRHYRDIALRSLRVPLNRHFGFLCNMLKVSVTVKPEPEPVTLQELFGPEYVKAVARLDFSKNHRPGVTWADEAHKEFQFFHDMLTRLLDRYAVYLEWEVVGAAQGLVTSDLAWFAVHIQSLGRERSVAPTLFAHASTAPMIQAYIEQFVALAEAYNEVVAETGPKIVPSDQIWRGDVMPALGSAISQL